MFHFLDKITISPVKYCLLSQLMLVFLLFLPGCKDQQEYLLTGKTMGTIYHIKYHAGVLFDHQALRTAIEEKLKMINQSMSTFDPTSEISVFNKTSQTQKAMSISDEFYQVLMQANALYQMTEGSWDGTVKPLVNLWGFGHTSHPKEKPTRQDIQKCLESVGFHHISITDHVIEKKHPDVQLNLASIAKGFGVDIVATVLDHFAVRQYLVEIGGEVFARGNKINGDPWRVGINRPKLQSALDDVYYALPLKDKAIATSGDYRNYFLEGNTRYSHVIDPKTGYPVNNGVVSVSVIANNCTFADGLATALMVMDVKKALILVNQLPDTECFLIKENQSKDGFDHYYSEGFPRE
ncbi:MAG: FAD:protein FMN transferase [Candidatus Magnetomorum sp.]|nr:FAD:protein FMN transferase [Candidatus Magnetomorum sp.]